MKKNNDECLICGSPLEYLNEEIEMECSICHKKELSKTRCIKGHYVCNQCHMQGLDKAVKICLKSKSKDPIVILNKLMDQGFCHMHGPEHHVLIGSALLTAYYNAGGKINLEKALYELSSRAKQVPGGACGFWGSCGGAVSAGMFISIITQSNPLTTKPLGYSNKMTSIVLNKIGDIGGPRCCKRHGYLAIVSATKFVKENFGINMQVSLKSCKYHLKNNQCLKSKCPFYPSKDK